MAIGTPWRKGGWEGKSIVRYFFLQKPSTSRAGQGGKGTKRVVMLCYAVECISKCSPLLLNATCIQSDLHRSRNTQLVGLSYMSRVFRCSLVLGNIALKGLRDMFTESAYMAISQGQTHEDKSIDVERH
jgi:hypothetical protein